MTTPVNNNLTVNASSLPPLGPSNSIQFKFAMLQLTQSQICKNSAEDYIKQIEKSQQEQKEVAAMIQKARDLQQQAKNKNDCTDMPADMVEFFKKRGLSEESTGNDHRHTKDEWEYNLKSLTNYQDQLGTNTQLLMTYIQDMMGQYDAYLQGAKSSIDKGSETTRSLARSN